MWLASVNLVNLHPLGVYKVYYNPLDSVPSGPHSCPQTLLSHLLRCLYIYTGVIMPSLDQLPVEVRRSLSGRLDQAETPLTALI